MRIIISKREYKKLVNLAMTINDPRFNKLFNDVLSIYHHSKYCIPKMIPIDENIYNIELDIDSEKVEKLLSILIEESSEIIDVIDIVDALSNENSMGILKFIISNGKAIFARITSLIGRIKNKMKR